MRICVVGCGAVGSLFAANLATLDDVEVWAFDLNESHIQAIKKNGLQLTGAGDVVGHPNATSDPRALPPCDFGIVATKAMHTGSAVAAARSGGRGSTRTTTRPLILWCRPGTKLNRMCVSSCPNSRMPIWFAMPNM